MKILFQGDSITDAGRDRSDIHNLGNGYPKYAAGLLKEKYPEIDFEFINLGVAGNHTSHLVERMQTDVVDIQPDIISILIGVNDGWEPKESPHWVPYDVFEKNYRTVLTAVREKTNAKIMMLEPFLFPIPKADSFNTDVYEKIHIIRRLAREFADVYVPTDGLLASTYIDEDPNTFSEDGIHPTAIGSQFIAKFYFDYICTLIANK